MGPRVHPLIGQRLGGRLLVKRVLGAGGFGDVLVAEQEPLGREVAVKVLQVKLSEESDHRLRFISEARAIAALNSPNIVQLYDFGRLDDGTLFMAMELVDGRTLKAAIKAGPMDLSRVVRIGTQLCHALEEAHRAGIVHRDLKPDNVMLTRWHGQGDAV